jgi:ubiquinone/menaquinone biosynthesis C-methylase UbiE
MGSISDFLFARYRHVCPWWLCWTFDNPVRRLVHNPMRILSRFVHEGDTVIDIGAGMGYFSIPMAGLVGAHGKVIALDVQSRMLEELRQRAQKNNCSGRIETHCVSESACAPQVRADFALAFWMIHEVPDRERLFVEIRALLKDNAKLLIVEPKVHVIASAFRKTVEMATQAGFACQEEHPRIFMSRACVMTRRSGG